MNPTAVIQTGETATIPKGQTVPRGPLAYLRPDSRQTVREALAEYYSKIDGLEDPRSMTEQARELFEKHDIAHVVFGCDTSLRQEVLIDFWTLFGSSVGVREYLAYLRTPEAAQVFLDAGIVRSLVEFGRSLGDVAKVIRRARKMTSPWPWRDHEQFMDTPLDELRRQLGIEILRPNSDATA